MQIGLVPTPHTRSLRLQAHCDCVADLCARMIFPEAGRRPSDAKTSAEDEERLRREELLVTEMWAESETMELQQKRKERQVLQRQTKLAEDAAALAIQKAWVAHKQRQNRSDRGVLHVQERVV